MHQSFNYNVTADDLTACKYHFSLRVFENQKKKIW